MVDELQTEKADMKEKILAEAMKWYEEQGSKPDVLIEDFVDMVISKTADDLFEKVKDELKGEFKNGNLTHPFVISSDYYLDLKFKDIKHKFVNTAYEEETDEF